MITRPRITHETSACDQLLLRQYSSSSLCVTMAASFSRVFRRITTARQDKTTRIVLDCLLLVCQLPRCTHVNISILSQYAACNGTLAESSWAKMTNSPDLVFRWYRNRHIQRCCINVACRCNFSYWLAVVQDIQRIQWNLMHTQGWQHGIFMTECKICRLTMGGRVMWRHVTSRSMVISYDVTG